MTKLDFKGLTCPQPVIKTKAFLDKNRGLEALGILVDNRAASENVQKFLNNQGFSTEIVSEGEAEFCVKGLRTGGVEESANSDKSTDKNKVLVMLTTDAIGNGDRELGEKLMQSFLGTLPEMGDSLWRIVLVNAGVKLTTRNSGALDALKNLEGQGVSILVCGTCLEHFKLMEQKQAGETTNMLDIVTSLELADKVINY